MENLWLSMRENLYDLMWVALGSAFGGSGRYFVSGFIAKRVGETFPWGTMVVNVTGAFTIGVIAAFATRGPPLFQTPAFWQLAVVGFIGTYTTVSSFSLQTLALVRDGEHLRASGNVLLSLGLGLSMVALGFAVGGAATRFGAL
jgi:CrcB protein